MNNEKAELINAIAENEIIIKFKKLESYIASDDAVQCLITDIAQKQKMAIANNNQELIANVLNEINELKTDINVLEYLNIQEEINSLMLNIKYIIESNLKG